MLYNNLILVTSNIICKQYSSEQKQIDDSSILDTSNRDTHYPFEHWTYNSTNEQYAIENIYAVY